MAATPTRETARIYQFPVNGRRPTVAKDRAVRPAATVESMRGIAAAESWYHQAALEESQPDTRRRPI